MSEEELKKTRILFIIYTPFYGYAPKIMEELNAVDYVVVTPEDFEEKLENRISDTVHLIKLTPDIGIDRDKYQLWFEKLPDIQKVVESIKTHNNM